MREKYIVFSGKKAENLTAASEKQKQDQSNDEEHECAGPNEPPSPTAISSYDDTTG
jgi:hypothetical protein